MKKVKAQVRLANIEELARRAREAMDKEYTETVIECIAFLMLEVEALREDLAP